MKVENNNQSQAQPRKLEWPSEVVLELIDLWRAHKCLYDKSHRYYTNKNAFDALKNIADNLHYRMPGLSPKDVRIKINYLRDQYSRELVRQQQNSSKNGTDSDPCGADDDPFSYEPTTYWFSKMSFLRNFIKTENRKHKYASRSSNTISPSIDESESDPLKLLQPFKSKAKRSSTREHSGSISNSLKEENSFISNISNDIAIAVETPMAATTATAAAVSAPAITTIPTSTSLTTTPQLLAATHSVVCGRQSIIQNAQSDVDAFANHIKLEMYKITDEELQDELQHKIQNLLYDYKSKQRVLNKQIQ